MTKRNTDEFLRIARERFAHAVETERDIRAEALIDLEFVAGDQWDAKAKHDRQAANRPALTFNKLPTYVQQVANEARQNKPQVKFNPVDSSSDPDTAEVYEGIARHIQYNSDADVAYETAIDYSASCSFGFFRLLTEYCDDHSFNQELKVAPIYDPFSVYGVIVPAALGQDCRYAFVVETISKEEFEQQYPDSDLASINFEGVEQTDWISEKQVRIAEYWRVESKRRTLVQLIDGTTAYSDEVDDAVIARDEDGQAIAREVFVKTVKCCKINGHEILPGSETEWAGSAIPIIPVLGKQLVVNGKPKLFSVIRFARDPQQLINYAKSRIAESLGTAPISPYVGAEGQFKNHESEWQTANNVLRPYLEYKVVDVEGRPVPPPQRQVYEPPIQALSQFVLQESDDIKAMTSIFDASLGNRGNETSGIAIARRQQQASISNLHFIDNLSRAHRKVGRMIAELIPVVYDTAREVQILGKDEEAKVVRVNQLYADESGKMRHYRLDAGKYDVTVTTGPSYTTKRQEAFDMLTQFAQAYPQLLQIAGDIVFRNSDIPGADEVAERMKKTLPPGLAADDKNGPTQLPPQVQQQMQMSAQMIEKLTATVHQLQNEIDTKRVEMESRERIAAMQEETKRTLGLAQISSTDAAALLEQEVAAARIKAEQSHDANMLAAQQAHQADQAAQQQAAPQMQEAA